MSTFQREFRYWVAKASDASAALSEQEQEQLAALMQKVANHRADAGKAPLECVVVESDWPIYDSTWNAIKRMDSSKSQREQVSVKSQVIIITNADDIPLPDFDVIFVDSTIPFSNENLFKICRSEPEPWAVCFIGSPEPKWVEELIMVGYMVYEAGIDIALKDTHRKL